MRTQLLVLLGSVILVLSVGTAKALGQQPSGPGKSPKGAPDEEREILKQIEEAYKAPSEVPKDVLKELRKAYQQPSPEREAKIFKEIRRLYLPTADQEAAILLELRKAYQQPSADQEERLVRAIERTERLPLGAVPPTVQTAQAKRIFQRQDQNGDGLLSSEEMPDSLRSERSRWDTNRDGSIDQAEYWAYYQGRLQFLSEQVASGQMELRPGRGGPTVPEKPRPTVYRAGKLPPGVPSWFLKLDTDGDTQLGLYEWKGSGRPIDEFFRMDRNRDGFVTLEELMRYLAQQPRNPAEGLTRAGTTTVTPPGKR